MRRITDLAQSLKTGSETRTLDQIRADVFLDLLDGTSHHLRGRKGTVDIHVDLETLARLNDHPGELAGYGPVIADIARQVAENPDAAPIPTIKQRLVRLARSTKMPARRKIKLIRRYLRMSQSQFAEAYGIPVRTLQNWEAGRREPEDGILSYLSVIADMPDQVRRSLRKSA